MSTLMAEAVPQPRVDGLVTDPATDLPLRRTEYSGTLWMGGRPQMTSLGVISIGATTPLDQVVYVPDSLPYRASAAAQAVVSCTVSIQSSSGDHHVVFEAQAALVPDPRGGELAWLQLRVSAFGRPPLGLGYRVVVQVPTDAVAQPATP
jgi:hypothetical protein